MPTDTIETLAADASAPIHAFERAGLGKAPYTFLGHSREVYQAIPGDPSCPIQPAGSCDYCGQGIYDQFRFRSADGRTFKVGCDCVRRAGDAGMIKRVNAVVAKARTAQTHARQDAIIATGAALLVRMDLRAALASIPSEHEWKAANGGTALDDAEWLWHASGRAGRVRLTKRLAAFAAEVAS